MAYQRNLAGFTGAGYSIGRSRATQVAWLAVQSTLLHHWWCPATVRSAVLRSFGARIAPGVLVRHRVRIHWPWKLTIGENSWIGEGAWILNLEPVTIGSNVCVSQDVLICTGSHDRRSVTFEFDNAPIEIEDGAWLAARSVILKGVTVGAGATIGANVTVARDIAPNVVLSGRRVDTP